KLTFHNFFKEDELYHLHLNNRPLLQHFHQANITYQTQIIKYKIPHPFLQISPQLPKHPNIHHRPQLKLISHTRQPTLLPTITHTLKP
ncbi:hypothetical protein, partial [Staphylococcus hominis]|uniref:hypothetical protein n=1 Tax=Staphylococcus hominis TaxID=1290 RepID=UPI001C92E837